MTKELKDVKIADCSTAEATKVFLGIAAGKDKPKNVLLGALVRDSLHTRPSGAIGHQVGVTPREVLADVKNFYLAVDPNMPEKTIMQRLDSSMRSQPGHWGIESFKVGSDARWREKMDDAGLAAADPPGWPADKKRNTTGAKAAAKRPLEAVGAPVDSSSEPVLQCPPLQQENPLPESPLPEGPEPIIAEESEKIR
jgi:hypothetical protein